MSPASPNSSGNPLASHPVERRAEFWRRALAAIIDAGAGAVAAFLLRSTIGMYFARRAVVTLRIGEPGTWWQGPLPLMLGVFGEVVYLLPFTLLVASLLDPLIGATIGKRMLGLHVRAADGRPASHAQHWSRAALRTMVLWGWTLALVVARWEIAVVASIAGGVILAGCLHDRLTGTRVYRRGLDEG